MALGCAKWQLAPSPSHFQAVFPYSSIATCPRNAFGLSQSATVKSSQGTLQPASNVHSLQLNPTMAKQGSCGPGQTDLGNFVVGEGIDPTESSIGHARG